MTRNVFKFIVQHSLRQQIYILLLTVASLPFYYASLDIPKKIVNGALDAMSADFLKPLSLFGVEIVKLDRLPLLFTLSGLFLVLVLINGAFKYFINVYKGLLGERMLRRLRYELYSRILRFPLRHFRRVSQGELIPMITAEVEPLGGFIGDAFALPLYQAGLLITALAFIFVQDPMMGLAAISLYPIQGYVIPKLQRRVNLLGKERVREVRKLSERIGETVAGAAEIHANDTTRFERAAFAHRLGRIFDIRYRIYHQKFFTKFLNNLLNHLTPFFFYAIGGYLVIAGDLTLGALVAVLAAYKDLAPPWRELLNYYQQAQDARIKYEQVVVQFDPPGMMDEALLAADAPDAPLAGELVAANVSFAEDGVKLISNVSFRTPLDRHLAIVGANGSGKEELTLLLARLIEPTGGRITIGGRALDSLPEAVTGRRIAYVGPAAHIFAGRLGDNLFYGLKHGGPAPGPDGTAPSAARRRDRFEARASGNPTDDAAADWIDYAAAGVDSPEALIGAALRALDIAEMADDVYRFGLRSTIDPAARPALAARMLEARAALDERLAQADLSALVERFDVARYNTNATVAENLLFGTPVGDAFDVERLAENDYLRALLDRYGLTEDLLATGYELARIMVELFSDLPPDHEFFEKFSFIDADDLPAYRDLVNRVAAEDVAALEAEDRRMLLAPPFKLIPARHALGLIDDAMQAKLLEVRHAFRRELPESLRGAVEFFDPARYNAAATLQDNILFGKVAYGQAQAEARIGALIAEVIDALGLRETVVEVGLDFPVGVGGGRLSAAQRQKLAIARAVLKRPDLIILNQATAPLDGASHNRIVARLRAEFAGRGVIWALHRPSLAEDFDAVIVLRAGRLVEEGDYQGLVRSETHFKELIAAE